jgi:hypothetical protein
MNGEPVRFESSYEEPYPLQVVGESYHREEIESILGYVDEEEGADEDGFEASLILDNNNLNDPDAVRIEIEGNVVGYLSRPTAKIYRQKLKDLGISDAIGICTASIRGGYRNKSTDELADFGVRLDIDLNDLQVYKPSPSVSIPKDNTKGENKYPKPTIYFLIIGFLFICLCLFISFINSLNIW